MKTTTNWISLYPIEAECPHCGVKGIYFLRMKAIRENVNDVKKCNVCCKDFKLGANYA